MSETATGRWWCPQCEMERSPIQVTYHELCTRCDQPVEWQDECSDCDGTGSLGTCHDGREQACEKCSGNEDGLGSGFIAKETP